jgi:cytidylate kinase
MKTTTISKTIAIDGPAAVGKSSVGFAVARKLGYQFIDSGALYRGVTWVCLSRGVDLADHENVANFAESLSIRLTTPRIDETYYNRVFVNEIDVTDKVYDPQVDSKVARVGENPLVRKTINKQLRTMASKGKVVMIGRDIGTEVLPNSEIKIYLDASLEVRAKRRFRDAINQGKKISYEEILNDMEQRDQLDSSRPTAPMIPAKDAIIINTDNLSFEETLKTILDFVGNN